MSLANIRLVIAAMVLVAMYIILLNAARADSGVTNDPAKLEYILTEKAMTVMAVQPDPVRGCTCHPPVHRGDLCTLPKGVGLWIKGVDKQYVLLTYPAMTEKPGGTCPRGTMVLMTRQEFARHKPPAASRRLPAEKLAAIVAKLIENGKAWP
jgi:hypothetical protein